MGSLGKAEPLTAATGDQGKDWPGMRMESRENWRRLQLLTGGQPLSIYTWYSRLQSMPEPYQLKGGQIVTRTDTTKQFLCGFMPRGSKGIMAHRSTAFTLFSCCSFCLLCISIKSTQEVHKSPARPTELQTEIPVTSSGDTFLCFATFSFQIGLRTPRSS